METGMAIMFNPSALGRWVYCPYNLQDLEIFDRMVNFSASEYELIFFRMARHARTGESLAAQCEEKIELVHGANLHHEPDMIY